ncbi:MAG: putative RNA methyltransferase [Collinsella sp.]
MLLCPVCHEPLVDDERGAACAGGHRFDRAREGYLYLLRSSRVATPWAIPSRRRAAAVTF